MKAVAPAAAPDVTYDDLDIAEGGGASAAFYLIVADRTLSREVIEITPQRVGMLCAHATRFTSSAAKHHCFKVP
jgi:hypothetical protein